MKMTKIDALRIQAEQVDHYVKFYGKSIRRIVAAATRADKLDGDGPHDVVKIDRHIPRGLLIEYLFENATPEPDEHDEILITPEMIAEGIEALRAHSPYLYLEEEGVIYKVEEKGVISIYKAMVTAKLKKTQA